MRKRLLSLGSLAVLLASGAAMADDKELLKNGGAPPNLLIVFGNSETTAQPIQGSSSAWDGDADSPASKMASAKAVLRQFINQKHTTFNIGMSAFSHGGDAGSVTLVGKHWLYSPLTVDFPNETWREPVGTIERWGPQGEGPCTNNTTPVCTDRSPAFITLPSKGAVETCAQANPPAGCQPFFGVPAAPAYICLDGTMCNDKNKDNATQRILVTLTLGGYGDAFTDGSLSAFTLGDHSMVVTKQYQTKSGGGNSPWVTQANTPNNSPGTVVVNYVPASTLTKPDSFYATKPGVITTPCVAGDTDCGKAVGFLNDNLLLPIQKRDLGVNATCSGWEFQSNSATTPLIKIPKDYKWGATCAPPQDSLPCANRLLRLQARLVSYNQATGVFTPNDFDNPGYVTGVDAAKYADGCDKTLLGAVDTGNLNVIGRQAILQTQNGSQVPLKNLLSNIYDYFTKAAIDGFTNGKRSDDPNKACRASAVILIYDSFNGCQGDVCAASVIKAVETPFKQIGVPVYVIGFGATASQNAAQGICIAENTGAFLSDGITPGYFPVSDAAGLFAVLNEIASILDQATQTFSSAAVSTSQTLGGQMAYFSSFSAAKERSIWSGRLGGYQLLNGSVQLAPFTVHDKNDPANLVTLQVPSNAAGSLIWNAGANLIFSNGTGATVSTDILAPGDTIHSGTYTDDSNDSVNTAAPTHYYSGRKLVFSLPQTLPAGFPSSTSTLPLPAADAVPETRYNMTFSTGASWWPALKALLGPQLSPPAILYPLLGDTDAGNSLRFIWGDRDAVTGTTISSQKYSGLKLGDIFHSTPLIVGNPSDIALFKADVHGYQAFFNAYKNRRRVLYVGANDGLMHAFDAGVVGRDPTVGTDYDLGNGAELFAFAPRSIMQIYKPLKDAVGPQSKQDEWTVDLSPSAADVFIDPEHNGTPTAAEREWRTVLVSGVREGSPFEGTSGTVPKNSQGSYYALDITQPDELVSGVESPGDQSASTSKAPKCLNNTGDAICKRDWPTVLWEITDATDLDAAGTVGAGFPDMGETWSKAALGRVKVCTSACSDPTNRVDEDRFVAIFGGGFDRERKNRRGNWLYMVDIETGKTLYKANSSCGVNSGGGSCTPTYFGSIPSEPAAIDYNDDGYIDVIYVGDLTGQLWRVDLTDLRMLSSPPGGRFNNQLDLVNGSGKPFLFFLAGPATPPAGVTSPSYPIYFRPEAINLGYNTGGKPALGIAFGTGDRDDIQATLDPSTIATTAPTYTERYYYVIDAANTQTVTESTSGMHDILSPTGALATSVPTRGWFLELNHGERVVGDSLVAGGVIRFPTYNPLNTAPGSDPCGNAGKCTIVGGTSRLYQVLYTTGNPYVTCANPPCDRGQTQPYAMFITAETAYISGGSDARGIYWSGGAKNPTLGVGRKITVRSWKEKTSRP